MQPRLVQDFLRLGVTYYHCRNCQAPFWTSVAGVLEARTYPLTLDCLKDLLDLDELVERGDRQAERWVTDRAVRAARTNLSLSRMNV